MAETESPATTLASIEEIQKGWRELTSRVAQLEAENSALEEENKAFHFLLERIVEHRQKSHGELVLLLTNLVSKLPINDIGVVVSRLVEHNTNVSATCAALAKGNAEASLPQPTVLKALEQTKRELEDALKPLVEEFVQLDTPFESEMLRSLIENPDLFFSPAYIRANRCFLKGQVPRERVVKQFGEQALIFFNDLTTDPKLNRNPSPEEIVLGFKPDFEALFQQHAAALRDKGEGVLALYKKVQRSKAPSAEARAQKNTFLKLSFVIELLHYYRNQNTEAPDVVFAQRLPALVEQLVIAGPQDHLNEKFITEAESLLAFIVNADHRHAVVNNLGKVSAAGRTLRYVLTLRTDKLPEPNQVAVDFVKHLIPPSPEPAPKSNAVAAVLKLLKPDMQRLVAFAIMDSDRMRKGDAQALAKAAGEAVGLTGLASRKKAKDILSPEMERRMAWDKIKDLLAARRDPSAVAAAVRDRLHAKYDADEMKQSWVVLTEADPIALIRVFCQLPYLANGKTDPVARAAMETYVTRLMHEKYAGAYTKVVSSLRNMFKANPHSPTLLNFMALVKWVDAGAADKLSADVGMPVAV